MTGFSDSKVAYLYILTFCGHMLRVELYEVMRQLGIECLHICLIACE